MYLSKKCSLLIILLAVVIAVLVTAHYTTMLIVADANGNIKGYKQDVDICMQFKYDKLNERFENVFQTSDANNGIRFELTQDGSTGNAGIVFSKNGMADSINIGSLPLPNIWHTLETKIIDDKIGVYIDDALIGEKILDSTMVRYDDVAIGTGFSRERKFSGEVQNFSMHLNKHTNVLNRIPFLVVLILDICLAYYLFNKGIIQKMKYTRGGYLFLLILSIGLIYRGTRTYIMSCDQYLYYSCFIGVYFLVYWLWTKAKLQNFTLTSLLASIFVFVKCFIIQMSFKACIIDFLSIFFLVAVLKFIIKNMPYRSIILYFLSCLGGIILGFCSIAAFYIHRVGNPGMPFGEEVQAIMQTNPQEAWEFLKTLFSLEQLLCLMAVILVCSLLVFFALQINSSTLSINTGRKKIIFLIVFVVAVWQNYMLGVSQSIAAPLIATMNYYSNSMNQMKYYQQMRENDVHLVASKKEKGETYVVVIGESANKRHMSSYGYFRKTTPWLDMQRNNANAVFMENAYASYVHTVPALLNALTSANQYNKKVNFMSPSIIEAANAAGFKTFWFSNQNRYGLIDNPLTIIANKSNEVYWTPTSNRGPDGELIKLLDERLKKLDPNENNLIVIHLIGSHEEYKNRLPKDYNTEWKENGMEYFGDIAKDDKFMKNSVDVYDATIKYTDENLEKIYGLISGKVNNLSAFVYLSDHGQDVFGRLNHNASVFNFEMDRIPMVTIISDEWKNKYSHKYEKMKEHATLPYTTDCFYDYMIGVCGIETDEYEADKDLTQDLYNITWDSGIVMWADANLQTSFYARTQPRNLSDDPLYITRKNLLYLNTQSDKYLAVACDSIASAREAVDEGFAGVEVNITPTENGIMIGHYPELTLNMTLDEWLSQIPEGKIKKFWFDTKMSKPENVEQAFLELQRLDKKYGLKDRVLLESSLVGDDMKRFSDAGWNTAYYFLPTRDAFSGVECPQSIFDLVENHSANEHVYTPKAEEKEAIRHYGQLVANTVQKQNAKNISYWAECYPFIVQEVVPLLDYDVQFATFALPGVPQINDSQFIEKLENYKHINIMNDKRMKHILLSPNSIFGIDLQKL